MKKDNNSLIRKVTTDIGTFTVYFPYAVFNPEDRMNQIPKVLEEFTFSKPNSNLMFLSDEERRAYVNRIHDQNALKLQEVLNKAVKFGISTPFCGVDLYYADREVVLGWIMRKLVEFLQVSLFFIDI